MTFHSRYVDESSGIVWNRIYHVAAAKILRGVGQFGILVICIAFRPSDRPSVTLLKIHISQSIEKHGLI